ncbi:RNA polymerase sigma factor [Agromyces sp. NPDC058136]|uniref:RNA polymerase sigma factor n=1 Tax=Agromyces sp. NPDC058136 TaxID=3346354 RepID=UPI0036D91EFD
MSTENDQDDWRRALAGDGEAFGLIFDRHRARIRRHAHGLVPAAADADDVVATTFLEAWRRRDGIRFTSGSMLPWLLRTATNVAHNHRRSTRRYRALLARLPTDVSVPDHADDDFGDGPAARSLRLLSLEHQHVITLCVLEGLSADEAAGVLGVRAGTVRSRLSRAKTQLRMHLGSPLNQYRPEGAIDEL